MYTGFRTGLCGMERLDPRFYRFLAYRDVLDDYDIHSIH